MRARWTAEEDALIREMVAAGRWHIDIAAELPNRTKEAISTRIGKLGLRMTREQASERGRVARAQAMARGVHMGRKPGCPGRKQSPEEREWRRRVLQQRMADPEWRAKRDAAWLAAVKRVDYRAIGQKNSARLLAWCPVHLRAEYVRLLKSQRIRAVVAREMILDEWATQLRRVLRQIADVAPMAIAEAKRQAEAERAHRRSLAGQIERVKAGAALVPTLRLSRALGYERSLTGNAEAML